MTKILIATGIYPPDIGGPATHTKILEEELPSRDFDVSVLNFGSVRKYPKLIRHIIFFVRLLVGGRKVDVIYALDPWSVGLPACFASKILRKRYVLRIAGDYAWEQATARFSINEPLDSFARTTGGYNFFIKLFKRGQKYAANQADKIVVPSKYLLSIVSSWGIPKRKISVVYNSFDLPRNMPNREVLKHMLQVDGKLILTAGRLVQWKGFDALIECMPAILKNIPDAKLVIVGSGPEEVNLTKLVQKLKLTDYVAFSGAVDQATLHRYVKASDCFVLNTFYEGFSHQLLEVMSIGVPIVTTYAGGNTELITHQKEGLLSDYNDREALTKNIVKILKEEGASKQMVTKASTKSKQFKRSRMIDELVKILA